MGDAKSRGDYATRKAAPRGDGWKQGRQVTSRRLAGIDRTVEDLEGAPGEPVRKVVVERRVKPGFQRSRDGRTYYWDGKQLTRRAG